MPDIYDGSKPVINGKFPLWDTSIDYADTYAQVDFHLRTPAYDNGLKFFWQSDIERENFKSEVTSLLERVGWVVDSRPQSIYDMRKEWGCFYIHPITSCAFVLKNDVAQIAGELAMGTSFELLDATVNYNCFCGNSDEYRAYLDGLRDECKSEILEFLNSAPKASGITQRIYYGIFLQRTNKILVQIGQPNANPSIATEFLNNCIKELVRDGSLKYSDAACLTVEIA